MKFSMIDTRSSLDQRVGSFSPIIVDEIDYNEYSKYATGEYILTEH